MLLANQFAIQMCRELVPLFPGFSERARETLLGYRWPGNIRELKNVVERSVYRHGTSDSELDIIINPFHQPLPLQSPPQTLPRPAGPTACGSASLQQQKPAAAESAAGEVIRNRRRRCWVNLPPAAGAAQKHQL
jgi:transcriptional regulator with AAA-type ATPase domain